MPNVTVLILPVSGSVTTNSTVINPFKYVDLNYLLTFSCVLSASDYKSPQYSFFIVYINIQVVQRGRRRCKCSRRVMKDKDRVIVLCVAFKVFLMSLHVNVTVNRETVNQVKNKNCQKLE